MTTTAARIRAELNGLDHGDSPAMPIAAVRAVLDLHRRYDPNPTNPVAPYLCHADNEVWPCPTVRAIATAMCIKEET